jgi:hypothetical protein
MTSAASLQYVTLKVATPITRTSLKEMYWDSWKGNDNLSTCITEVIAMLLEYFNYKHNSIFRAFKE